MRPRRPVSRRLRAEQGLLAQPLPAEQLHLTLYQLGDFVRFPQELADQAMAAAATLSVPAFELTLDQALSLPRREARSRPCVLLAGGEGLAALKALRAQLVAALKTVGLYRYASFTPHLTLLNDPIGMEQQPIEAISWTASELVLVNGLQGKTEPVVLARWPLLAA